MAERTYEELKHKTVAQLREIAAGVEHDAVKGYTQLNKEHLIAAICKALNIDTFTHHHAEGIDASAVKSKLKELKKRRDEALSAHDHEWLKAVRREMHSLKVKLHRAAV
jgi:Rho termination factor, N-terminal domain